MGTFLQEFRLLSSQLDRPRDARAVFEMDEEIDLKRGTTTGGYGYVDKVHSNKSGNESRACTTYFFRKGTFTWSSTQGTGRAECECSR